MSAAEVFIEQGEDPGLTPVQMSEEVAAPAAPDSGRKPGSSPGPASSDQTAPADRDNAVEPEQVVGGSAAVPGRVRPKCSIEGCGRPHKAHGLCDRHYRRSRSYRRPRRPLAEALLAQAEVFWSRVDQTGDCWVWQRWLSSRGYGRMTVGGQSMDTHRLAWMLANGPIPEDLHVLHRCDNPPCVRPDHLFLGTHLDNMRDRDTKGRVRTAPKKLTATDVADIRRRLAEGETQVSLALSYGVAPISVSRIAHRETWKSVAWPLDNGVGDRGPTAAPTPPALDDGALERLA